MSDAPSNDALPEVGRESHLTSTILDVAENPNVSFPN
jgi:hypothetical protein